MILALVLAGLVCGEAGEAAPSPPAPEAPPEGLTAEATPEKSLTDLSLEELMEIQVGRVSGASGYVQKIREAPASVTIVTADDIRKYGYRTLADVLRSIPGLHVTYDRSYSYLGIRGFGLAGDYNTRFLLLVDGHRLNDNVFESALIGNEFPIDVDLIEKVEFIRGPSSSLYGSNAVFGVVNVITRQGKDMDGVEASGSAGSFGTYQGRLSAGKLFQNGIEVMASATAFTSEGQTLYFKEFDDPATRNGYTSGTDEEEAYKLFSRIAYKGLALEAFYGYREKGIPTAAFGTMFDSSRNVSWDTMASLDLSYNHTFEGLFDLMARVYLDSYAYKGQYDFATGGDPPSAINQDLLNGDWWGTEGRLSRTFFDRLKVILGAEFRDNFRQDQKNMDVDPRYVYLDDQRHTHIYSTYVQGDLSILENLRLNAGVRYDYYDTFGGHLSPRAGLMYSPFDRTDLKFLYGQAFRAPSVNEFYYNDGGGLSKSNSELKPEIVDTYQLVWEQGIGRFFRLTTAGFYYEMHEFIQQETDPSDGLLVFRNSDHRIRGMGMEFGADVRFQNGIRGRASYTLQDARDTETDTRLTNSPQHLVKFNLIVPIAPEKLFAGLELQYTGERKTLEGHHAEDFAVANVTIFGQQILKGLDLSASVYNIFNTKYSDPGGSGREEDLISQDGINFRIKLTFSF